MRTQTASASPCRTLDFRTQILHCSDDSGLGFPRMTNSAFDAWQRDPATRALFDFANSPAMTEAQKLANAFADLPGSRAFDEAQRFAGPFNQAIEDVKRLTSAQTLAIDHKLASGYNQALEDVKRLTSAGGHAITEAQKLKSAFGGFADSPAMRDTDPAGGSNRIVLARLAATRPAA